MTALIDRERFERELALVGLWLMYVRRVMFVAARTSTEHGSSSSSLSGFDFGSSGSGCAAPGL